MRVTPQLATDQKFRRLDKLNVPRMFRDAKIEDFNIIGSTKEEITHNKREFKRFKDYYDNLDENLDKGIGLYLCGPVGVGKTMLMAMALTKAIESCDNWNDEFRQINSSEQYEKVIEEYKHICYFIQATTLAQLMFTQNLDESEMNIRRALKRFSVLAIDDITKMLETKIGNEISFVDDILRHRYYMKLTTMITAQTPLDKLPIKLSEPIYDLVRHRCIELTFVGPSQRNLS